jgi:hypothetical protein
MSFTTLVKYNVPERDLVSWLQTNIGFDEAGRPKFSYEVVLPHPLIATSCAEQCIHRKSRSLAQTITKSPLQGLSQQ